MAFLKVSFFSQAFLRSFILATSPAHLLDLINSINYEVYHCGSFSIYIPLESKYSPRNLVFKLLSIHAFINWLHTIILYLYLFGWGDHWCPMHCSNLFFQIYCAPPNLGITRTCIYRLDFAQRPIYSGLRFFNEPEISDSGPPA